MKSALQFVLFQGLWFGAVLGATHGWPFLGPALLVPYLALHLAWRPGARVRSLAGWLAAGLAGTALDAGLARAGLLVYPLQPPGWPSALPPPFIATLWIAFATLPAHSLAWLAPRPRLAFLFGALGGPLSYYGGVRVGAVAFGPAVAASVVALALEYALLTPLFLRVLGPRPALTDARRRA